MALVIRKFRSKEFDEWKALWLAYYKEGRIKDPSVRLLRANWKHIFDKDHPLKARAAEYNGELVGFITTVKMFNVHSLLPYCYVGDVFVLEEFRRKKIAWRMLKDVFKRFDETRYSHVEWKTYQKNEAAQRLYNKIARKPPWIIYERPGGFKEKKKKKSA